MNDAEETEVSTHLYDTVPIHPPKSHYPTLESSMTVKKKNINLPPEVSPAYNLVKSTRPMTVAKSRHVFSNLSTGYDISYRYSNNQKLAVIPDLSPDLDPTLANIYPPQGKFKPAQQRKDAQELKNQLIQMEKEAEELIDPDADAFTIETAVIEKKLKAYLDTLSKFSENANKHSTARGTVLYRITEYYQRLSNIIPELKKDFAERFIITEMAVKEAAQRKKEIQEENNNVNASIDRTNKAIESLKSQINEYRNRCKDIEGQLRDLANEKAGISHASYTNQMKLLDIGRQINEKRDQLRKIKELAQTLTEDINARTEEMRIASNELSNLEDEISTLKNEETSLRNLINQRNEVAIKLRNTPLRITNRIGMCHVGLSVNRMPKPEAQSKPRITVSKSSDIDDQHQFSQIKSDMEIIQDVIPKENGKIVIRSANDLVKLRDVILKNNKIFDFNIKSITKAHYGNFYLNECSDDQARIFSKWMMERIIKTACFSATLTTSGAQTEAMDQIKDESDDEEEEKVEKGENNNGISISLLNLIKQSRFCGLLTSDYSTRKPKPFDWVIKTIRSIFDEKTIDDKTNERDGLTILNLPEYVLIWAFRQYGNDELIQKGCWDLFISAHFHMQRYLEIALFCRFLDEYWTTPQLSFFLKCRAWCLKRCISIPVEHLDLNEYFTETYLTKNQVQDFIQTFFQNSEPELVEDLTIRGCSCVDQERGNEDENACIPLQRILEIAVGEQFDARVRRLRKMLAFFRPVPRMSLRRFAMFVRSLIVNIDTNMINSLFRSSLVQNKIRTELDQDAFSRLFNSLEPVEPNNSEKFSCSDFAEFSNVYAMVLNRWNKFAPFLAKMMKILTIHKFEESKIILNQIRHQIFLLLESKVSYDGILFYQSYHRVLQTIMKICLRLNLPDAFSFSKQISDFEDLITNKYEILCDMDPEYRSIISTRREELSEEEVSADPSLYEDADVSLTEQMPDE